MGQPSLHCKDRTSAWIPVSSGSWIHWHETRKLFFAGHLCNECSIGKLADTAPGHHPCREHMDTADFLHRQRQTCVFSFSPGGISCLLCHQQSRCIISYFSFVASLNPLANSLRDLFFCFFLTLKQSSKGKKKIISDKSNVRIHLILRFFFSPCKVLGVYFLS